MTPALRRKLDALVERREEVERLLADPAIAADQTRFRNLSREFATLQPVADALAAEAQARADLAAAEAMRGDPELRELADDEIASATARLQQLEGELLAQLVPKDARDSGGLYLEVRAGTGGDEAAIFAGDLFRMYSRYAEAQGWRVEVESASPGEHGGYKELVARVEGDGAYAKLKYESGPPRAARAGDRIAGPHPHLGSDGGDHRDRTRRRHRHRDQPGRPAHRHVPLVRCRRPARQQDRIGDPHHPPAHRRGRRKPDRAQPARQPRQGDETPAGDAGGCRARETHRRDRRGPQVAGRQRRPQPAHPHLQLPAGPDHRPPRLGTGSGAIALALAVERPRARIVATDRSPGALAVARDNAARLGLANVEFRRGDWCAPLAGERFELIVSNPPYVATADPRWRAGELRFEPAEALVAGAGGLDALRAIIAQAPSCLSPGGWLLLEHGYDQGEAAPALLRQRGFVEVVDYPDAAGVSRCGCGRWPG
jgi:SAM-dependent methyltransferase